MRTENTESAANANAAAQSLIVPTDSGQGTVQRATSETGMLALRHEAAPQSPVDLSDEGSADWVHWGHCQTGIIENRKAGVARRIGTWRPVGKGEFCGFHDAKTAFCWSDGAPLAAVRRTLFGIFSNGGGFAFDVAAAETPRTLRVYAGFWGTTGTLTATLSDGSAAPVSYAARPEDGYQVYTLAFQAARPDQKLTVRWEQDPDSTFGNVTLLAATLSGESVRHEALAVTLKPPQADEQREVPGGADHRATLVAEVSGARNGACVDFFEGDVWLGRTLQPPHHLDIPAPMAATVRYWATATEAATGAIVRSAECVAAVRVKAAFPQKRGSIAGTFERELPEPLNLSRDGKLDWAHWGYIAAPNVFNHKAAASVISAVRVLGDDAVKISPAFPIRASWQDGVPVIRAEKATGGFWVSGDGNGFEFSVPADRTERELKVYLATWAGCIPKIACSLSDGSAPDWVDISMTPDETEFPKGVYTVRYRAAGDGQRLRVRCTIFNKVLFGNLTLTAATLSDIEQ